MDDIDAALKPILRWVGGKQQIATRLLQLAPQDAQRRVYREPFFGAGSLFFALRPKRAIISDANEHLINCYKSICERPDQVHRQLRIHESLTSEDYYYSIRQTYNTSKNSAAQAARFIYLNKACFNGVFRVNTRGEFNVPYGHKTSLAIPHLSEIHDLGNALRRARIFAADYSKALASAKAGDFVYLDPPYPPLNGTAYFTHYTKERFDAADQKKLAEIVQELDSRGCLVMISNADLPSIRDLYRNFNLKSLSVTRFVTSSRIKHRVDEVIIRNYL